MKYKFSAEQYSEIKAAQKKNRDKQIENRLKMLALRCEGKHIQEIAEMTGFGQINKPKYLDFGGDGIVTVSKQLGHAQVSTTGDIYSLCDRESQSHRVHTVDEVGGSFSCSMAFPSRSKSLTGWAIVKGIMNPSLL